MRHKSRVTGSLLAAACWIVAPLTSQTLRVRVVEDSTRAPLPGVVVRLLLNGHVVVMGLTGETGRVSLVAPAPGRFELAVSRLGHEGFGPEAIDVPAGASDRVVVMPQTVRMLPAIVVTSDTRCTISPGQGSLSAALWEDVRTALAANAVTAREGRVLLHVVRYERDLSPSREFLHERIIRSHVTSGQPFIAEPPEVLAQRGYVYHEGDTVHYAAPDAALLLTDAFVEGHCFGVREGPPGTGRVGLAFEPVSNSSLPDVRGVLWIARETRELDELEFQYTGLEPRDGLGDPGGSLRFERLAGGEWIIREWSLFMPQVTEVRSASAQPQTDEKRYRLRGWTVAGGRARIGPAAAPGVEVHSLVTGVVTDSLTGGGLAGALVTIDGEPDSARTDSSGAFRWVVPGFGPRIIRVIHDRLGLVPDNSTQEARLTPERATEIRVAVPPVSRFVLAFCGAETGKAGVLGVVRNRAGVPVADQELRAAWTAVGSGGHAVRRGELVTSSMARGVYAFCNLPPGSTITITSTGREAVTVSLAGGEFRWLEWPLRR